jgi:hypothetical protein
VPHPRNLTGAGFIARAPDPPRARDRVKDGRGARGNQIVSSSPAPNARPVAFARKSRRAWWVAALGVVVAAGLPAILLLSTSSGTPRYAGKAPCLYASNSVRVLQTFERMVGRTFSCALVFNNAAPDWAGWESPWFLKESDPAYNWRLWARAPRVHRQLIITQNLFPSALNHTDWLHAGAAGLYAQHARALARNLISAGLGNSVIRLAHEANDTSAPYSLGSTRQDFTLWRRFWRNTVIAMRSIRGAHFLFDWCVNAYWRPIPLSQWYPGNDVVDIIGIDAYDAGVPVGQDRWTRLYTQPDGIGSVLQFARARGKPVSLPEWGLWWPNSQLGGGDDPNYVNHVAEVTRDNRIAYQSYFYSGGSRQVLDTAPLSLSAYRRHFGAGGDSVGAETVTTVR